MSALIVIPARWASTRFPGKPLADIAGKSLIRRVYERALGSTVTTHVWVATDDTRVFDHVRAFGGRVVTTRDDHESGTDRIAEALGEIESIEGRIFEQVVNVQGDEPLIDMACVDEIIRLLQREKSVDVATLCCPIRTDEEFRRRDVVKVVRDLSGNALYFSRAPIPHDSPALARRHVGLYAYQRRALLAFPGLQPSPLEREEKLEQLRLLQNGFKITLIDTESPHAGVDRPEDVERIAHELSQNS